MRRVLLTIVTASLAATMFFVPSAAAQTEAAPDAEAAKRTNCGPHAHGSVATARSL